MSLVNKEYYQKISNRLAQLDYRKIYTVDDIILATKNKKQTFINGKHVKGKKIVDDWLTNVFQIPCKPMRVYSGRINGIKIKTRGVIDGRTPWEYRKGCKIYHQRFLVYTICCFLNNGGKVRLRKRILYSSIDKLSTLLEKEIIESNIVINRYPGDYWPDWRRLLWRFPCDQVTIQYKNIL